MSFLQKLLRSVRSPEEIGETPGDLPRSKESSLLVEIASYPKFSQAFPELRPEFLSYARTSGKADRTRLEQAIRRIYLNTPGITTAPEMIWLSSAPELLIAATVLNRKILVFDHTTPPSSTFSRSYSLNSFLDQFTNHREQVSGVLFPSAVREALDRIIGMNAIDWRVGDGVNRLWQQVSLETFRHSTLTDQEILNIYPDIEPGVLRHDVFAIDPEVLKSAAERLKMQAGSGNKGAEFLMECASEIANNQPLCLSTQNIPPANLLDNLISQLTRDVHSPLLDSFELARIAALSKMGFDISFDDSFLDAVRAGGWWIPFDEICLLCDNPVELRLNDRDRLHNQQGPALVLDGGFESFYVEGFRVPKALIDGTITVNEIDAESNIEIRRVMIETFGLGRYMLETGAEKVHEDECGVLYQKRLGKWAEPIMVVKVINSTEEPDGRRREYFLRVPPRMVTAREAVAWTFGLERTDYDPAVET